MVIFILIIAERRVLPPRVKPSATEHGFNSKMAPDYERLTVVSNALLDAILRQLGQNRKWSNRHSSDRMVTCYSKFDEAEKSAQRIL